jgi:hypothetical protein
MSAFSVTYHGSMARIFFSMTLLHMGQSVTFSAHLMQQHMWPQGTMMISH